MIPQKLKKGDEIRVISPSRSLAIISEKNIPIAKKRLNDLGFKVTFSKNVKECDAFNSSSIKSRIEDLHEAFSDKNVKAILTTIGGFNSNQLLRYIDWNLIKSNPKILCGFSDITALSNAIFAKTGVVGYSGPHFSSFSMLEGLDYTVEYFKKCLINSNSYEVTPSKQWSDDEWYLNQIKKRKFIMNKGVIVINEGSAEGTIIGGNLCTFNLLQGTEYMPSLKNSILFIEDDEDTNGLLFDRDLQSLIHLPDFNSVQGIVIGRFQNTSNMTESKITKIIKTKKELDKIPVVYGYDFGHTTPTLTFPIGGRVKLVANGKKSKLDILQH